MATTAFEPFADQAVFHIDPVKPTVKHIGGVTWIASTTKQFKGLAERSIVVECSLPVGAVPHFDIELVLFGVDNANTHQILKQTVDRADWTYRSPPTSGYGYGLGLMIKVLGKSKSYPVAPHDLVFEVGGREFPASSYRMSCLFYQGALERALSDVKPVKIKLDGSVPVSAENFERFMAVVNSRDMSALSKENIRVIRPLAVGFGIRELVQSINQFLLRAEDISLFEKFKLADQWQDRELSVGLTAAITSTKDVGVLLDSGMMDEFSKETQKLIMSKVRPLF